MTALPVAAFVAAVLAALMTALWLIAWWFTRRALRISPEAAEMRRRFRETPMPRPVCRDCGEYIRRTGEHQEEWTHVVPLPTWPHRAQPVGGEGL